MTLDDEAYRAHLEAKREEWRQEHSVVRNGRHEIAFDATIDLSADRSEFYVQLQAAEAALAMTDDEGPIPETDDDAINGWFERRWNRLLRGPLTK